MQLSGTTALIITVSAGGSIIILAVALLVYMILRCQRRRRPLLNQSATERRLSRYPGGHLSITPSEADRIRLPRYVQQRRFSRSPYGFFGRWKSIGSRDSLSVRSFVNGTSRITPSNISYPGLQLAADIIPRPLPLSRIGGNASAPVRKSPLSPITERNNNIGNVSPHPKNHTINRLEKQQHGSHDSRTLEHDKLETQRGTIHPAHRRSVSAGRCRFTGYAVDKSMQGLARCSYNQLDEDLAPFAKRRLSLYSQHPGNAPKERMESPPPELPREYGRWSRVQPTRSRPSNDCSRNSMATSRSISPSAYGEDSEDILKYLNTNTNLTALDGVASELFNTSVEQNKQAEESWCTCANRIDSHPDVVTSNMSRSQVWPLEANGLSTQYSRGSQSAGTGFPPFFVDSLSPSPNASCRDVMNRDAFFDRPEMSQSLGFTKDLTGQSSTFKGSREVPMSIFMPSPGNRSPSRVSASVLREASGNKSSPCKDLLKRPSSISSAQPFVWDELKPGKASSMKSRSEGHKRQSRQRICFVPSRPSSFTRETTVEEVDEDISSAPANLALPGLLLTTPRQEASLERPPSCATFDPKMPRPVTPMNLRRKEGKDYAPVLSFYNSYDVDARRSGGDNCSTPTRKPSLERKGNHGSMVLTVTVGKPSWPLADDSGTPDAGANPDNQLNVPSLDPSSQYFPQPPTTNPPPEWRLPKSRTIRGPRAAPARRSPTRRSPNRLSPVRKSIGSLPHTGLVVAQEIRKKNSEIWDSDSKHYLNLPDLSLLPGTPEVVDFEGFELETPKRHADQKATELGDSGRKAMNKAWKEAHRKVEFVGQGVSGEGEWPSEQATPQRIYDQVNHINGDS